jgi:lysophospholipase L1-like esterase
MNSVTNSTWRHSIFFIIFFLVVFLILEIYLRSWVIRTPAEEILPGLGMVPVSNSLAVWGIEGHGVTRYSSNGEIFTPEHDGASVVVLGDSYTEALQMNNEDKYVSVAENLLSKRNISADLHNFSRSGRNVADYVYMAPVMYRLFSPSIVVVQVDASDFLQAYKSTNTNYFDVRDGKISLTHQDDYFVRNTFDIETQNLLRKSSIASFFMYRFSSAVDNFRSRIYGRAEPANESLQNDFQGLSDDEKILLGIQAIQEAYADSEVLFLVVPGIPVIDNEDLIWENHDDEYFVGLLQEQGNSDAIYPAMNFRELHQESLVFPRGFFNTLPNAGHLNRAGHMAVGEALADSLEILLR